MSLKTFLFENGTDGATQTTTNTGGSLVQTSTYATFDAAAAASGSLGGKWAPPAGTSCFTRFLAAAANTTLSFSGVVTIPAAVPSNASNNASLATIRNGSGSACRFVFTNSGQFQVQDSPNLAGNQLNVGTVAVNTKYRVEAQMIVGGSTTTGTINVQVYNNTTGAQVGSVTSTSYNLGTTALVGGDFGFFTAPPADTGQIVRWDNIQFNDGSSAVIGAYTPPAAPTAAFTSTPNGLQVTFDGSASTGAGSATISNYAWNFGNSTTASGSSATTTTNYAATGSYTVTLTVTDSNGQTGSVSHTVAVKAAASSVGVTSVITSTGWTVVGSAPDILTAVTDADTSTGIISSAAPTNAPFVAQFEPIVVPAVGTDMTVTVETDMTGASSGSLSAKLIEGSTTRATASAQALVNVATGSTYTHSATFTFTAASIAAVTNWNALKLELDATAA